MALLADQVAEKIHHLSPGQLAEVDSFITSLEEADERAVAKAWTALSSPVFERIWSNPEDAIYDDL